MFRSFFYGSCQSQKLVFVFDDRIQSNHLPHRRLAKSYGPCLVQNDRIKLCCQLKRFTVLEKNAPFCPLSRPCHNSSWSGKTEGTRAGNDQNGHHAYHGRNKLSPYCPPQDKGQEGYSDNAGDENSCHPICKCLNGRLASLGFLDHADNSGKCCVFPYFPCFEFQAAFTIYGTCCYTLPWILVHRDGLTGKHGFINA